MASSSAMRRKAKATEAGVVRDARVPHCDDPAPLTPAQIREIKRRVRDVEDGTRYLLVSTFSRRFVLYYDVSNDGFVMNDPSSGTLFKRRSAASAIQHLLRKGVQIARCRVDRHGRLVKSAVIRLRPDWLRTRLRRTTRGG